jgi:hypothetical protein
MPDFAHGKLSKIYLNGIDLSRIFNSISVTAGYDTSETTTFGQGYQSFITGLRNGGELSLDGRVDAPGGTILRSALIAAEGRDDSLFSFSYGLDVVGALGNSLRGLVSSKEFTAAAEDIAAVTVGFAGNRGVDDTRVINSGSTILTTTGFTTAVDDVAASPAGAQAMGYLHILELTGGTAPTVAIKIQTSPDNSTWTDLITFTTYGTTAVNTAERKVTTGAVTAARWVRAGYTFTGAPTSVRFALQFARGRVGEDVS